MTPDRKKPDDNAFREAAEELLTDPDSPENGPTSPPPQTIDAEPADDSDR